MQDLLLNQQKKALNLRVQNPVTFGAEINLPVVFNVNGMDEFHGFIDICVLQPGSGTLCNNGMAQVTIFRNDPPFITLHPVIMAAETTV